MTNQQKEKDLNYAIQAVNLIRSFALGADPEEVDEEDIQNIHYQLTKVHNVLQRFRKDLNRRKRHHERSVEEKADQLISQSGINYQKTGEKTLTATLRLPSGFELTEAASCIDPENYDEEVGRQQVQKQLRSSLIRLVAFRQHQYNHNNS